MIEKLTESQKARFAEFVEKWTQIGLSTEPADRPKAEQGIKLVYGMAGLKAPKVVWCTSPFVNGLTMATVLKMGRGGDSVRDSVGASVWASVRDSVWASGYGQHDANWLAFYRYFKEVCKLEKETEKLCGHWLIAESANWYIPHKNICWISERHNIVRLNSKNRLHCENGPALAYPDGFSIYVLNGIRMKPEYILTPADKFSPETVLKEQNVDVRRELLRKVGVAQMQKYGKEVEQSGYYKLLDMSPVFPGIPYAPHLLMKNPSVDDTWHLEGVGPECRTIQQAINWRAGNIKINWTPAQLS